MKKKLRALILLCLIGILTMQQYAYAYEYKIPAYFISTPEQEIMYYNKGVAQGSDFYLNYADESLITLETWVLDYGYSIQDYVNSSYGFYNTKAFSNFYVDDPDDESVPAQVYCGYEFRESNEQTNYVYSYIRNLIRNNKYIITASDYEKAKWAYDWVRNNIKYDKTLQKATAYHGLTSSTVCNGYSLLYYVFATELGLNCYIVNGMANGGLHAWNVVQMEDGKWYCVDTTFASTSGKDYFLKGEISFNVNHTLNECFEGLLDISQYDYVNTGNSRRGGVLASVYDVKMDVFKKNILGIGDEYQWLLDNPNNIDLTFTSDNEDVAKVDKNGKIIAVSEGTATIKVINEELGIEQSCIIVVDNYYTKIVEVEDVVVKYGKKKKLKINVKPYGKQLENVKYESLDKSIATVNDSGTVKGVRIGTTHIRITYDDGKELMAKVTVKPYVEKTELNIDVGDYVEIGDIVQISKKGIKDLKVKVSNTKVATVNSSGWIRGLKEGTCKIYVYDKVTGKKVTTLNVKVTK